MTELMRYLSDEWLAAANEAVSVMEPIADASIGFDVRATAQPATSADSNSADSNGAESNGAESYALDLGPDRVAYHRDLSRAELTLRLTRATAAAIATGELSAQRAFLSGDLQVAGDVRVLLGHTKAMATIDDLLVDLRSATDFS